MLTAEDLSQYLADHAAFIMSRGIRAGHKGEFLLDYLGQVALDLWHDRETWPDKPQSILAVLRGDVPISVEIRSGDSVNHYAAFRC